MFFKDVISKEKADRIRKECKPISFREIAVIISRYDKIAKRA